MVRVFVSSLFHEGNSFSAVQTTLSSFCVVRGAALTAKAQVSNASLGGACRRLERAGALILPGLSAVAPPGGPIVDAVYERLRDDIVAAVRETEPDGVYLDLHGAMVTEILDDPEGDLIAAIRKALRPRVVIAVSLDLHAHVTDAMLANADIIVACKENPHTDYPLAGERAVELMLAMLEGRIVPVTAAVRLPMIVGVQMETAHGPLCEVHQLRRQISAQEPAVLDISIYNTTTLVDVADGGQCITVTTDGAADVAAEIAAQLAHELWLKRFAFKPDFVPLEDMLADVAAERLQGPVIVGDQGDRVLAGAAGDGTVIISELLSRWHTIRALIPLTDPEVVAAAGRLGVGSVYRGPIGGRLSKGISPVDGEWRIEHLGDGHFVHDGPFLANEPGALGATAVLHRDNVTVLVTSLPGFTQDPAAFRSQGVDPAAYDIVVTKSGHHFKISFASVGPCIVVDTPGISNFQPGLLPFKKRRPIFPEDEVPEPNFAARLFGRVWT
ncbi:M81 family metallopeptidase [Mesorhizobium sp. M0768]|uniref:M81 family metallopeptidase n=1 Tax=Mesorhizobium sp. M0768 TaxID=2956996 RepID=UPI00333A2532